MRRNVGKLVKTLLRTLLGCQRVLAQLAQSGVVERQLKQTTWADSSVGIGRDVPREGLGVC